MKYLAVAALSLLIPQLAWATAGENEWRFGIAATNPQSVAVGAGVLRDLSDFWAVGISARGGGVPGAGPFGAATADVRVVLDALQWIPALELSAGAQVSSLGVGPFARALGSLTWRPARSWGIGAHAGAQWPLNHNVAMEAGIQFVYFTGSGIGLDL